MSWPPNFEKILCANLPLLESRLLPEALLVDLGLDSLGTVTLIMELEEGLGVSIPDELLVTETFATPCALWKAISGLMMPVEQ